MDQQAKPKEEESKLFILKFSPKFHMLILKRQVQLSGLHEIAQTNETRVVLTWNLNPARRDGNAAFFQCRNAERSYPWFKWDGYVTNVPGRNVSEKLWGKFWDLQCCIWLWTSHRGLNSWNIDFRNSVLWLCRKDDVQGKQQFSIQIFQLQEFE